MEEYGKGKCKVTEKEDLMANHVILVARLVGFKIGRTPQEA
jgi:hypothetical protein